MVNPHVASFQTVSYCCHPRLVISEDRCCEAVVGIISYGDGFIEILVRNNYQHWTKNLLPCDPHVRRNVSKDSWFNIEAPLEKACFVPSNGRCCAFCLPQCKIIFNPLSLSG